MESKLIKCPKCKCLFLSAEDLESHYNAWHSPGGIYYSKKDREEREKDRSA
ncbi:MAG: hypothetical protein QXP91_12845 [Candidatus Methanomethylicia archaeon]